MPHLSFAVSRADARLLKAIAARAIKSIQGLHAAGVTELDVRLIITACHAGGCPLRLEALLAADGFSFAHDILGIRRHLDPATGKLADFTPRFHQRKHRMAA